MFEKIKEYLFILSISLIASLVLIFLILYVYDYIQVSRAYSDLFNYIFNT